jgi:hypothetical protein
MPDEMGAEIVSLSKEVTRLKARVADLEAQRDTDSLLFHDIEWNTDGVALRDSQCPCCYQYHDQGHAIGCRLAARVAASEGQIDKAISLAQRVAELEAERQEWQLIEDNHPGFGERVLLSDGQYIELGECQGRLDRFVDDEGRTLRPQPTHWKPMGNLPLPDAPPHA